VDTLRFPDRPLGGAVNAIQISRYLVVWVQASCRKKTNYFSGQALLNTIEKQKEWPGDTENEFGSRVELSL
jgi:hypothetical protein